MRHRERERQRHRGRRRLHVKKPDVGLDPRTPGSSPEPKADTQSLSHPGVVPMSLLSRLNVHNGNLDN